MTKTLPEISTVISPALIKRENPQSPITETDLENYVIESIWRVFDRSRLDIASKCGASEFELGLKDARVIGFKIDGHKVVNPEGFTGKTIEILALVTVARKGLGLFSVKDVAEEGCLKAYMLSSAKQARHLLYAETDDFSTKVFAVTPNKVSRVGEFDWGKANILKTIKEFFGGNSEAAEAIYKRFLSGELSSAVTLKLEKILKGSLAGFVDRLADALKGVKDINFSEITDIFVKSFHIPALAYGHRFTFHNKRAKIVDAGNNHAVLEFIDDRSKCYERYNSIAKKRMKWMNAE